MEKFIDYLDPKRDFVFKRLFSDENSKDVLLSFINAVLKYPKEKEIKDVTVINTEVPKDSMSDKVGRPKTAESELFLLPENGPSISSTSLAPAVISATWGSIFWGSLSGVFGRPSDKESRFDVRAKLADGSLVNIEIQVDPQHFYKRRSTYYLSKLYEQQLTTGEDYDLLNPAIAIHILNFNLFNDSKTDVFHRSFTMYDPITETEYSKDLELHTIELKKLQSVAKSDILSAWCLFLTGSLTAMESAAMQEPIINKAKSILEMLSKDESLRYQYEMQRKAELDRNTTISHARTEGEMTGEARGEAKAHRETAKILKASGTPYDVITRATGLTKEQIDAL